MILELGQVIDEMESNDSLAVLLLTGAPRPDGRSGFCAGADLKEQVEGGALRLSEPKPDLLTESEAVYTAGGLSAKGIRKMFRRLEALGKPTIAAIDGVCTAGGIELACCFDIRLVSETAEISDMHIKNVYHIGGAGSTPRMARILGPSWAKKLAYTGIPINGAEACRIGFANHVYPPGEMLARAKQLAHHIATTNVRALRMAKCTVDATVNMDYQQALDYSYLAGRPCWARRASAVRRSSPSGEKAGGATLLIQMAALA